VSTTPYWLEESVDPLPAPRRSGHAEVAVIGGGVTGCSCALTLAERGVDVRLYEQRTVAGGASGRNGGFALRGGTEPYDILRHSLGAERARELMDLTERTIDRVEGLAGDACRRTGSVRLAADEAELDSIRCEHDALREDGYAVDWVERLEPPLDRLFLGAIFHPPDAAIVPARWVRRLARRASEAGATIVEGRAVAVDELDADVVVVCADGFTASVLPQLAGTVVPTRGQVIATAPLPELRYSQPHYARVYDYWHQLPDGRLIFGGHRDADPRSEETEVEETTPLIQGRLEAALEQLTGGRPEITHRWAGIWGATPDRVPLAGLVPGRENVWVAGGYTGHGNVLGLACGDLVARAILGDEPPELALFDPARF
jgi:glycine/D-amino acid oxidase-like deaminating enzyme